MNAATRFAWVVLAVLGGAATLHTQEPPPTPATSLEKLKDGNNRFATDMPSKRDVGADRRKELTKGQHPFAVVLTCADSRVSPELLFDTGLGELFVLRVAGNIADPAVVGSIEYAVEHLHAPLIVVLGHESCGAVAAAIDGSPLPGDLGWLVKQVKIGDKLPADKDAKLAAGVRNNILAVAADLKVRSKLLHEEADHKKILIVPAVYSLKSGKVEWLAAGEKRKKTEPEEIKLPEVAPKKATSVDPTPKTTAPVVSTPKITAPVEPAPKKPPTADPAPTTPPTVVERQGPYIVEPAGRFPRLRALFRRGG